VCGGRCVPTGLSHVPTHAGVHLDAFVLLCDPCILRPRSSTTLPRESRGETPFEVAPVLFSEEQRKKAGNPMPWHRGDALAGCIPASRMRQLSSATRAAAAHQARLCARRERHEILREPFTLYLNMRVEMAKLGQSSAIPSGLKWERIGTARPLQGRELRNEKLARGLERKAEFTEGEWSAFGIRGLLHDDFISSADSYFKPASPDRPRCPCSAGFKFECRLHTGQRPVRLITSSQGRSAGAATLRDCLRDVGRDC